MMVDIAKYERCDKKDNKIECVDGGLEILRVIEAFSEKRMRM
jgi:hypothetical protein